APFWRRTQNPATVGWLEGLHAKLYLSEDRAMVTSMNLLRSSEQGSWEVAVEWSRGAESTSYEEALAAYKRLAAQCNTERPRIQRAWQELLGEPQLPPTRPSRQRSAGPAAGHCIRNGERIPFNPERPLCPSCYAEWARWKRRDFTEQRCHCCGLAARTS